MNKNVHVLHISTKDEIELLKSHKTFATCEATPQHLFFKSPDCYERLGTFAQMNPPIEMKIILREYGKVLKKIIDVIGSDHAPHTIDEKKQGYPNSPSGMTGVQTLLPIMLNFVNEKRISIHDLVRLVSFNPSRIYKILNKGEIKIKNDADLTIVDLDKHFTITNQWIASKSGWTPYDNVKVKGFPIFTIINGVVAMRENHLVSDPIGKRVKFAI